MRSIKIVDIYDEILEEFYTDIVVEANGKKYCGALFFELEDYEHITYVLEEKKVDCDDDLFVYECYKLMDKHGIAMYETTLPTMYHWALMQGLTKGYSVDIYEAKNNIQLIQMFGFEE